MADNDIPLNADKLLFAQELVNYIFRCNSDVYVEEIPEDTQDDVYEGFTETVQDAVEFIEELMEKEVESIFFRMQRDDGLNAESFVQYAAELRKKCFPEGFDAENFLNYCVHVSLLAERFYHHDIIEAPNLAVSAIMASFQDYDMFSGGWNTLQLISQRVQRMSLNMPTPSPSSNDVEEDFLLPEDAELQWIRNRRSLREEEIYEVGDLPEESP